MADAYVKNFLLSAKKDDLPTLSNFLGRHENLLIFPEKEIFIDIRRLLNTIISTGPPKRKDLKCMQGLLECLVHMSRCKDEDRWEGVREEFTSILRRCTNFCTHYVLGEEKCFVHFMDMICSIVFSVVGYHQMHDDILVQLSPPLLDIALLKKTPPLTKKLCVKTLTVTQRHCVVDTRRIVTEIIYPKLAKLFECLRICGDIDMQFSTVELILRFISAVKEKTMFFHYFKEIKIDILKRFSQIRCKNFEEDCRMFLYWFNQELGASALVFSIISLEVYVGQRLIHKHSEHENLWIDFNKGAKSVSFWCDAASLLPPKMANVLDTICDCQLVTIRSEAVRGISCKTVRGEDKKVVQISLSLSKAVQTEDKLPEAMDPEDVTMFFPYTSEVTTLIYEHFSFIFDNASPLSPTEEQSDTPLFGHRPGCSASENLSSEEARVCSREGSSRNISPSKTNDRPPTSILKSSRASVCSGEASTRNKSPGKAGVCSGEASSRNKSPDSYCSETGIRDRDCESTRQEVMQTITARKATGVACVQRGPQFDCKDLLKETSHQNMESAKDAFLDTEADTEIKNAKGSALSSPLTIECNSEKPTQADHNDDGKRPRVEEEILPLPESSGPTDNVRGKKKKKRMTRSEKITSCLTSSLEEITTAQQKRKREKVDADYQFEHGENEDVVPCVKKRVATTGRNRSAVKSVLQGCVEENQKDILSQGQIVGESVEGMAQPKDTTQEKQIEESIFPVSQQETTFMECEEENNVINIETRKKSNEEAYSISETNLCDGCNRNETQSNEAKFKKASEVKKFSVKMISQETDHLSSNDHIIAKLSQVEGMESTVASSMETTIKCHHVGEEEKLDSAHKSVCGEKQADSSWSAALSKTAGQMPECSEVEEKIPKSKAKRTRKATGKAKATKTRVQKEKSVAEGSNIAAPTRVLRHRKNVSYADSVLQSPVDEGGKTDEKPEDKKILSKKRLYRRQEDEIFSLCSQETQIGDQHVKAALRPSELITDIVFNNGSALKIRSEVAQGAKACYARDKGKMVKTLRGKETEKVDGAEANQSEKGNCKKKTFLEEVEEENKNREEGDPEKENKNSTKTRSKLSSVSNSVKEDARENKKVDLNDPFEVLRATAPPLFLKTPITRWSNRYRLEKKTDPVGEKPKKVKVANHSVYSDFESDSSDSCSDQKNTNTVVKEKEIMSKQSSLQEPFVSSLVDDDLPSPDEMRVDSDSSAASFQMEDTPFQKTGCGSQKNRSGKCKGSSFAEEEKENVEAWKRGKCTLKENVGINSTRQRKGTGVLKDTNRGREESEIPGNVKREHNLIKEVNEATLFSTKKTEQSKAESRLEVRIGAPLSKIKKISFSDKFHYISDEEFGNKNKEQEVKTSRPGKSDDCKGESSSDVSKSSKTGYEGRKASGSRRDSLPDAPDAPDGHDLSISDKNYQQTFTLEKHSDASSTMKQQTEKSNQEASTFTHFRSPGVVINSSDTQIDGRDSRQIRTFEAKKETASCGSRRRPGMDIALSETRSARSDCTESELCFTDDDTMTNFVSLLRGQEGLNPVSLGMVIDIVKAVCSKGNLGPSKEQEKQSSSMSNSATGQGQPVSPSLSDEDEELVSQDAVLDSTLLTLKAEHNKALRNFYSSFRTKSKEVATETQRSWVQVIRNMVTEDTPDEVTDKELQQLHIYYRALKRIAEFFQEMEETVPRAAQQCLLDVENMFKNEQEDLST